MNIELKPCPFCGGEAKAREWAAWSPTIYGVTSVVCTECAAGIEVDTAELWLHDAAWYWNSRAERTCRIVKTWSDSDFVDGWRYRCSECMCFIPVNERDPETGDVISAANFCPNCGAKVVE